MEPDMPAMNLAERCHLDDCRAMLRIVGVGILRGRHELGKTEDLLILQALRPERFNIDIAIEQRRRDSEWQAETRFMRMSSARPCDPLAR